MNFVARATPPCRSAAGFELRAPQTPTGDPQSIEWVASVSASHIQASFYDMAMHPNGGHWHGMHAPETLGPNAIGLNTIGPNTLGIDSAVVRQSNCGGQSFRGLSEN
jgi:hypothetical protein